MKQMKLDISALEGYEMLFESYFARVQSRIGQDNAEKGFDEHNENPLNFAKDIALIHTELSEALEADRTGAADDKLPDYDARAVELADAVIRIMHCAAKYNWPLGEIILAKLAYNRGRPFKHGAKRY